MTERDEALDVYGDNTSVTSERPPSIASTAGASSFDSAGQDQESESVHQSTQSNRPELRRMLSGTSSTSGLTQTETSPPSLGRSQSMTDPSRGANTRRREKTAVGYACLNCKKAHLACDGKSWFRKSSFILAHVYRLHHTYPTTADDLARPGMVNPG